MVPPSCISERRLKNKPQLLSCLEIETHFFFRLHQYRLTTIYQVLKQRFPVYSPSTSKMGDAGTSSATFQAASQGNENPLHRPSAYSPQRKLKIVTIGAGFSGLIFAHKLQHERPEFQQLTSHKIFESRSDIGGTWLVNRYPGVQCDVPAHVYVSF